METLRPVDDETIRRVVDRIAAACDPEAIILFGSARYPGTGVSATEGEVKAALRHARQVCEAVRSRLSF